MLKTASKIQTEYASYEMRDRYLYIRFKDNSIITLEEAKTHVQICEELCGGKKLPFVIDGMDVTIKMNDEARRLIASSVKLNKLRAAQAILANVTQTRLLAKFYIKHHSPVNPVRIFDNLPDALNWLRSF